MPSSTVDSIVP